MRRLGIHSFVWTDGRTQAALEKAMEQAGECGYRIIELAYLRPEQFDLDRLAKRAKAADLAIVVTIDRKSTRLNSSHVLRSRMPSSA